VTEERYIELMHQEIDGVNSPDESRELREYLKRDAKARRHYEELVGVAGILECAEEVSPPRSLRREIMRSVAAHERAGSGLLAGMRRVLVPEPRLRPAFAFAGGVAVGLVLFAALSFTLPRMMPGDNDHLFGTLGGRCYVTTEPVSFDVPGASGRASVRYCAENVTLELSLASESEVLVVLSYDEEVDFDHMRALSPGDHAIRVSGHRAELTHAGNRDYDLFFTDYTESHLPMRMRVIADGRPVFDGTVPPGRE
jgi:hypothetical protein